MPALTVLQLDTYFPRIAGDVACPDTYTSDIEIIRVPRAHVATVVTSRPDQMDISAFEVALKAAQSDLVVTSCGFLAYWQDHLSSLTGKTVITSSLTALDAPDWGTAADDLAIVTYDAAQLGASYFQRQPDYLDAVFGLDPKSHLRQVIGGDRPDLSPQVAQAELTAMQADHFADRTHILLECTNLPPYKAALRQGSDVQITDILTLIEDHRPGLVAPAHR